MVGVSLDEMNLLVTELFCGPLAPYGPFQPPGDPAGLARGTELVDDLMYRYELVDPHGYTITMQAYRDVSRLGGQMWEQEVRVLLHAAARRLVAVPKIVRGGQ